MNGTMLLLAKPDLSQSDLDVAADLAENGSDAWEKARRLLLAIQGDDYPRVFYNDADHAVTMHGPFHASESPYRRLAMVLESPEMTTR